MKKFDSLLLKVFLYGLPLFVVLAVYAYYYGVGAVDHHASYVSVLNNGIFGLIVALWMALSVYLSVRLLVSGAFREQVLARITFMRERDERESLLTGRAARTTFLTSLALLILLFCLNSIHVSVYRLPPEKAVGGKTGVVSLGLSFGLWKDDKPVQPEAAIRKQDIFSYVGLPISSSTVILLLIVWQVATYNYTMRRLMG